MKISISSLKTNRVLYKFNSIKLTPTHPLFTHACNSFSNSQLLFNQQIIKYYACIIIQEGLSLILIYSIYSSASSVNRTQKHQFNKLHDFSVACSNVINVRYRSGYHCALHHHAHHGWYTTFTIERNISRTWWLWSKLKSNVPTTLQNSSVRTLRVIRLLKCN